MGIIRAVRNLRRRSAARALARKARPLRCRLFHADPIFARDLDGARAWECWTCGRRWRRVF
jgi:hypothetical protein